MKIKFLPNHPFSEGEKKKSFIYLCAKQYHLLIATRTHHYYPAASRLEKQDQRPKREELKLISQGGGPRINKQEKGTGWSSVNTRPAEKELREPRLGPGLEIAIYVKRVLSTFRRGSEGQKSDLAWLRTQHISQRSVSGWFPCICSFTRPTLFAKHCAHSHAGAGARMQGAELT